MKEKFKTCVKFYVCMCVGMHVLMSERTRLRGQKMTSGAFSPSTLSSLSTIAHKLVAVSFWDRLDTATSCLCGFPGSDLSPHACTHCVLSPGCCDLVKFVITPGG